MSVEEQPNAWPRVPCSSCQRSYKFYCPKCFIPLGVPKNVSVPKLKLPLQVHVWFQDKIKKSTAPHAKVLAPQDVRIVPYPRNENDDAMPIYTQDRSILVYPSYKSEVLDQFSMEELRNVRTLIFIDCPWQKAPVIMNHPSLANLRHVRLSQPPKESNFWRYHKAGAGCVSTIEGTIKNNSCKCWESEKKNLSWCTNAAIKLMLEEYTAVAKTANIETAVGSENTQLSDLLFFFKLQFLRIVDHFNHEADPDRKPPMDAAEKERRRLMYSQKDMGKKRRLENKLLAWAARSNALQEGKPPPVTTQGKRHHRCYNCKKDDHRSIDCLQPCRYCKMPGHFSASCSAKQAAYEREMKSQQTPRTKAL